jgi:hypothetical protein
MVTTVVDLNTLEVVILGCISIQTLHKRNLFRPPVCERFVGNKLAIYMDTMGLTNQQKYSVLY